MNLLGSWFPSVSLLSKYRLLENLSQENTFLNVLKEFWDFWLVPIKLSFVVCCWVPAMKRGSGSSFLSLNQKRLMCPTSMTLSSVCVGTLQVSSPEWWDEENDEAAKFCVLDLYHDQFVGWETEVRAEVGELTCLIVNDRCLGHNNLMKCFIELRLIRFKRKRVIGLEETEGRAKICSLFSSTNRRRHEFKSGF